jgi:hypothetical protein
MKRERREEGDSEGGRERGREREGIRTVILAESQTALKLSFNRPDQDLARPRAGLSRFVIKKKLPRVMSSLR